MTQNQLPRAWVEKIFTRLQGVYGREFLGQYGTGMVNGVDPGIENAKQVWAEELAGFIRWPDAIAYALEHLPERTPNAIKFRELCRMSPRKEDKPLELEHKLKIHISDETAEKIKTVQDALNAVESVL